MVIHSVCSWLFSGVRTPGPRPWALIYSSSITDVSTLIYKLRRVGEGGGKGWDLAGGGLRPHGWVMVGECGCELYYPWGKKKKLVVLVCLGGRGMVKLYATSALGLFCHIVRDKIQLTFTSIFHTTPLDLHLRAALIVEWTELTDSQSFVN